MAAAGALGVGVGFGVTGGAVATRTPVAAYRALTPYRELTDWPLIAVTTYHVDARFQVGQFVPHEAPVTVPVTVSLLDRASVVLMEELVVGPVRTFTPEHAGAMVCVAAEIGATAIRTSMTAVKAAVAHRPR